MSCPRIGLHKPRIKMDKKSKLIRLPNGKKIVTPKAAQYFTKAEREHIIQEYLSTPINKNDLWKKYTGKTDHGRLLNWMRKMGYGDVIKQEKHNFVDKTSTMLPDKELPSQQLIKQEVTTSQDQQAKIKALEKELKLSKKELESAQLKVMAYSTMIDIAEKEFNIPIRKK